MAVMTVCRGCCGALRRVVSTASVTSAVRARAQRQPARGGGGSLFSNFRRSLFKLPTAEPLRVGLNRPGGRGVFARVLRAVSHFGRSVRAAVCRGPRRAVVAAGFLVRPASCVPRYPGGPLAPLRRGGSVRQVPVGVTRLPGIEHWLGSALVPGGKAA